MKKNLLFGIVVVAIVGGMAVYLKGVKSGSLVSPVPQTTEEQPVAAGKIMLHEEAVKFLEDDDKKIYGGTELDKIMGWVKDDMAQGKLYPTDQEYDDIIDLGRGRDRKAVPLLIEILTMYRKGVPGTSPEKARADAAHALGIIGDPSALPALREAAGDNSEDIRRAASMALLAMNEPEYARQFILRRYKEKGAYEFSMMDDVLKKGVKDPTFLKIAIEASSSKDEMTRLGAASQLSALGEHERALITIKEIAETGKVLQDDALMFLIGIDTEEARAIVVNALTIEHSTVGPSVLYRLQVLGERGNDRAIKMLTEVSENAIDVDIRARAEQALKKVKASSE